MPVIAFVLIGVLCLYDAIVEWRAGK